MVFVCFVFNLRNRCIQAGKIANRTAKRMQSELVKTCSEKKNLCPDKSM